MTYDVNTIVTDEIIGLWNLINLDASNSRM